MIVKNCDAKTLVQCDKCDCLGTISVKQYIGIGYKMLNTWELYKYGITITSSGR